MTLLAVVALSGVAQAADAKKPGVTFYGTFASSYFFRGNNMFSAATKDDAGKDEAFPVAPVFQPGFTVATPLEGFVFDVWSSFSLTERDGDYNLKSLDEVDLTAKYSFENKIGSFSVFMITYMLPNTTGAQYTEMGFSYTAPVILSPTLLVANDVHYGLSYMAFSLSHALKFGKDMAITPALLYGVARTHGSPMEWSDNAYIQFDLPFSMSMGSMSYNIRASLIYKLNSDADPSTQFYLTAGVSYAL